MTINKSGVHTTLSAKCGVIAAANPNSGHYNKTKSIIENVKISPALLSRFDLIFLMLDTNNSKRDQKMLNHIIQFHKKRNVVPGN